MISRMNSSTDEELAPALRLSTNAVDEQIFPLRPEQPAWVESASRPTIDGKGNLAMGSSVLQRSYDASEAQVIELHFGGSPAAGNDIYRTTSPDGNCEDLERVLGLSQLSADISEEQIAELNRSGAADENQPASLLAVVSPKDDALHVAASNGILATGFNDSLELTPRDDYSRALALVQSGTSSAGRCENSDVLPELEEGISALKSANDHVPEDHPMKAECLNHLGVSFYLRFEHTGDLVDLNEAIAIQRRAIRLNPTGLEKATCLSNLGNFLLSRFERLGNMADIDEAITAQQQAVHLFPDGHPDKAGCLNNLGTSFQRRFGCRRDFADLDEAIAAQQKAVHLIPDSHPDHPVYLASLGNFLLRRFEHLINPANPDNAITAQRRAVHRIPGDLPNKPRHPETPFQNRFEHLGDLVNLDDAITAHQQALRLTPSSHPHTASYLSNLGNCFLYRFKRLGDLFDLDEAVVAQRHAVRLTPDNHHDRPGRFNNLGISLQTRFQCLGDLMDLDKAIIACEQAVRFSPDAHFDKPRYLDNLANSFFRRFERLDDLADLDEAITAQQHAVRLTPYSHPDRPGRLNDLGNSFLAQLSRQPVSTALADPIITFAQSAQSPTGPPSVRFAAAHKWASLCFSVQSRGTLEAYSTLVNLLPCVVWLGGTVQQRYKDISRIGGALADAAMAAIHFGELNLALEWMEQGRSIVWGQMLRLRTPLDELYRHYPDEANALERVSRTLDSAAVAFPNHADPSSDDAPRLLARVSQVHRRLAEEHGHILAGIRNLPGFRDFLQPENSTSLFSAATSGPVVVVNAHEARCDALILLPHSLQVSHVPLPGIRLSVLQEIQIQLAASTRRHDSIQRHYAPHSELGTNLSNILEWLWLHMAKPILSYLKLLQKPTCSEMPHITWCLAGSLTFLPIHAAGFYGTKDQPKIFDYVISSFTPTLTALLSAKRPLPKRNLTPRLLTVSQPATPGQNILPGTAREVDAIQALQSRTGLPNITRLDDQDATVAAVLRYMKECSWIHLACHGVQNSVKSTDSAFLLIDNPLTLTEIMKQSFSHGELAVLFACQTAKGDHELPEESIHLAAGMMVAGYRSVVGTIWSIRDDDAPIVAEKFYRYLIEEADRDSSRAAYALHDAVAQLRDIRGESNFASWVPFIHLGICSPPRPLPE